MERVETPQSIKLRKRIEQKRERRAKIETDLATIQSEIFALCDELWIAEHNDDTAPLTYDDELDF